MIQIQFLVEHISAHVFSSSDHQHKRHGGRHIQEAGEGTRLLRDRCGRGEQWSSESVIKTDPEISQIWIVWEKKEKKV